MAGDWIKMRADLLTHPKVVRIVSALKADKLRVIGGLHAVWCLFDAHSIDGTLDGYTSDALDDHIGWPGFCAAMVKVGWLEDHGESLATPRFDEHNGQSAKRRATETQRKRMAREIPEMSAVDADKKRSREEKRREEIDIKEEKGTRAKALPRPDDVELQVWTDWLQLRKAKGAPVTATVLKTARKESALAAMTLTAFLEIWCARGSQGLEAAWLRDSDKPSKFAKPAPNITVPSRIERDPELTRLDIERARSVPMPAAIRDQMQKLKFGVPA